MKNKGITTAGVAIGLVVIIAVTGVGAFLFLRGPSGSSVAGKKYTGQSVTVDGKIITAKDPAAATNLNAIISALGT